MEEAWRLNEQLLTYCMFYCAYNFHVIILLPPLLKCMH